MTSPDDFHEATSYDIELENPEKIRIRLRRYRFYSDFVLWEKDLHRIDMGDPEFDQEFALKGNKENIIRSIFDPYIRKKLMDLKNTFYELEISITTPEVIHYIDDRRLEENILNVERFSSIVNTSIDIVEKIERVDTL